MDKQSLRRVLLLCAIIILATAIIIVAVIGSSRSREAKTPLVAPPAEAARVEPTPRVREVEKIVEIEKEITAEVIQDGLNDMGVLLTEEYYFTEVVKFSSIKTLFKVIELGITESSYLASYDGVITAGIDFSGIRVEKDEAEKRITVYIPLPEIRSVDIDPNSFELYSEKEGLGNPISIADYNQSLVELEERAAQKAVDRGLLERAAENAQTVIKNFILSLFDKGEYTLRFLPAES